MLTKDKITEIFCITGGFCRKFDEEVKNLKKLSKDDIRRHNRYRSFHHFIMNLTAALGVNSMFQSKLFHIKNVNSQALFFSSGFL